MEPWLALVGVIVSAFVSWVVASLRAKHEIALWRVETGLEQAKAWLPDAAKAFGKLLGLKRPLSRQAVIDEVEHAASREDAATTAKVVLAAVPEVSMQLRGLVLLAGSHKGVASSAFALADELDALARARDMAASWERARKFGTSYDKESYAGAWAHFHSEYDRLWGTGGFGGNSLRKFILEVQTAQTADTSR